MHRILHNLVVVVTGMLIGFFKELANHDWTTDIQTFISAAEGAITAYIVYHICHFIWHNIILQLWYFIFSYKPRKKKKKVK